MTSPGSGSWNVIVCYCFCVYLTLTPEFGYCLVFSLYQKRSHQRRHILCTAVHKICVHLWFATSVCLFFQLLGIFLQNSKSSQLSFVWKSSSAAADLSVLLHHHAAAQLLLGTQTQVLHVGVCAGDRTHAPHGRLGNGRRKGAVSYREGLLFDKTMEMRGWLLADVQASFQEVSGRGHRGQRRKTGG